MTRHERIEAKRKELEAARAGGNAAAIKVAFLAFRREQEIVAAEIQLELSNMRFSVSR